MLKIHTKSLALYCSFVVAICAVSNVSASQDFTDATGDAKTGSPGQGSVAVDVTLINVQSELDGVRFTLNFNPVTPIAAASADVINSLSGFMDFDIDQRRTTGIVGGVDGFRTLLGAQPTGLGVDLSINLSSESNNPGLIELLRVTSFPPEVIAELPISYSPTSASFSIPLIVFRQNGMQNAFDFALLVGSNDGATDAAPATFGTVTVPEPVATTSLTAAAALMIRRQGRRSAQR